MACMFAHDLLQELDCLATEAGQARVQHEGDQRDDRIHVGPGETQGRRWTEPSERGGSTYSPAAQRLRDSCSHAGSPHLPVAFHVSQGGPAAQRLGLLTLP